MAARQPGPAERSTCKTCNGHGATDLVPMTPRNREKHLNKYGLNLIAGLAGGNHMGTPCTNCDGRGNASNN